MKRVYAAMPTCYYGSARQAALHRAIEAAGHTVCCPSGVEHQEGYSREGMAYFAGLVDACDEIWLLPFGDGSFGAGVCYEALHALNTGKPVRELTCRNTLKRIGPIDIDCRGLSVEDTRVKLKTEKVVKPGQVVVVWFSFGAASAAAWKLTHALYSSVCDVRAVNNPVAEEDPDNARFGLDVARWVGSDVIEHTNPEYPTASARDVWERRKAMSFPMGAPCTTELKKRARQDYEKLNPVDWHVLGFTHDEQKRYARFVQTERENVLPVLIDAGLSKQGCLDMIISAGVSPPRVYSEGYPNANCIGCVKATSATYWNLVRKTRPEIFEDRADQSRRLGVRLARYKGRRVFLDELPETATGRPLKTITLDCGIFCEEKP
jgi:hypothetical protein